MSRGRPRKGPARLSLPPAVADELEGLQGAVVAQGKARCGGGGGWLSRTSSEEGEP
jgi:hypothetical protein